MIDSMCLILPGLVQAAHALPVPSLERANVGLNGAGGGGVVGPDTGEPSVVTVHSYILGKRL